MKVLGRYTRARCLIPSTTASPGIAYESGMCFPAEKIEKV